MEKNILSFSSREFDLIIESLEYYLSEAEIVDKNLYNEIGDILEKITKEII